MKLNLSTPPKSIIKTLGEEWQQADKVYIEYKGGAKAYDEWQDEVLRTLSQRKKSYIADVFKWVSPDGNKWCVFEDATSHENGLYTHTCHYGFCYYETIPFAGIFMHTKSREGVEGAVIYESHFFERLNERKIMKWEGLSTLIKFISENHANMCYCTDVNTFQYDIRINGCIGRGWAHKDCPTLIRIKTVLSDEQLTTRQRKATIKGRRIGDAYNKYIDLNPKEVHERAQAKWAKAIVEGKTEEFEQEALRDFARIMDISIDEADIWVSHQIFLKHLLIDIKPSLGVGYRENLEIECGVASLNLKKRWDEYQDEEDYYKFATSEILRISKLLKLNITKQSILQALYRMRKRLEKYEQDV